MGSIAATLRLAATPRIARPDLGSQFVSCTFMRRKVTHTELPEQDQPGERPPKSGSKSLIAHDLRLVNVHKHNYEYGAWHIA